MTKHHCNRCGKIIDKYNETDNVKEAKAIFRDGLRYFDVDFCSDCADMLMSLINDFWEGGTK